MEDCFFLVLVVGPGHVLVAVDVAQADIRVLAAMAESFPFSTGTHLWRINKLKHDPALFPARQLFTNWRVLLKDHRNPHYMGGSQKLGPAYSPKMKKVLAEAFQSETNRVPTKTERRAGKTPWDFYNEVAVKVFGSVKSRKIAKILALSTVNGKTAKGLADDLFGSTAKADVAKAKQYIQSFYAAFPDVDAFKTLITEQIARTGMVETFGGRPRASLGHRWMVTEPELEIRVTYARSDDLWLRVRPLKASLRCLTCYVVSAEVADDDSPFFTNLIYHHEKERPGMLPKGRLSDLPYRFFNPPQAMMYCLPIRNVSWRSIRAVRTLPESANYPGEFSLYRGFDKIARQLFNHIAQGGTADVVKLMMLEVCKHGGVCERYNARIVNVVHDELVFEVPEMSRQKWCAFMSELREALGEDPPGFKVPIKIEVKIARKFGEM